MAKRILFFSCEPGGAEVLIPVIKLLKENNFDVIVTAYGHASMRFKEKNIDFEEVETIKENDFTLIDRFSPDLIITSATSLPHKDMSEKYLWKNAKEKNIKTIAFLDQWQNYAIRFSGTEKNERLTYLPTFINCINDIGKEEMIAEGFNANILKLFGQPYLSSLLADADKTDIGAIKEQLKIKRGQRIFLFVSEALKENYGETLGYDQYSVLDFFLNNLNKAVDAAVIIKLHPKDDLEKFSNITSRHKNLNFKLITNELSPLKCILIADFVFGMTSIMLIEAYILGKFVTSLQPNLIVKDPLLLSRGNYISKISTYEDFDVLSSFSGNEKHFEFKFLEKEFLEFVNENIN